MTNQSKLKKTFKIMYNKEVLANMDFSNPEEIRKAFKQVLEMLELHKECIAELVGTTQHNVEVLKIITEKMS